MVGALWKSWVYVKDQCCYEVKLRVKHKEDIEKFECDLNKAPITLHLEFL